MSPEARARLLDYVRGQNSTGFLVIRDGRVLVEANWPAPAADRAFAAFVHGRARDGALLVDVASAQKSFVSVLVTMAADKRLVDLDAPVSRYIGQGWSRASPAEEARIRVVDVLTMSSGLDKSFGYAAPAGTVFSYNTPVYAVAKRILVASAKRPLDAITRDWLTAPLGMRDTAWRKRPAAFAEVGNDSGLVTSPRDMARFGGMILNRGVAENGKRIVSEKGFAAMFARSAVNPAYGRLWWLNGSAYVIGPRGRRDGPLVPAAPADMVAALGAFDNQLYVVPSRGLVVVRTGAAAPDKNFDQQLWQHLMDMVR
ncbi:serine hydrolase [Sphingopyxis sp.]|uniref:serine hydrolase domain-containing protein n=1 Tax=Sphingopyxis sp. TaxID=1908224 RepID=UPI0026171156|nr:serine hydrolase [Sphingopyxis sp.]MCW0199465.1 beta-lactamase family protein [Sphingopyxis sp.]